MNQQKPTLGRIVHAVFDHGDSHRGQVTRPAIIVRVWSDEMVNVQAFTDGGYGQSTNDNRPPVLWLTSLHYDSAGDKVGTWHWPQDKEIPFGA